MKFVKKPIEVEARQFTEETRHSVYNWASSIQKNVEPTNDKEGKPALLIPTAEGEMLCSIGDWVIKEPNPTEDRKLYPCKPDIFEQTYEPTGKKIKFALYATGEEILLHYDKLTQEECDERNSNLESCDSENRWMLPSELPDDICPTCNCRIIEGHCACKNGDDEDEEGVESNFINSEAKMVLIGFIHSNQSTTNFTEYQKIINGVTWAYVTRMAGSDYLTKDGDLVCYCETWLLLNEALDEHKLRD